MTIPGGWGRYYRRITEERAATLLHLIFGSALFLIVLSLLLGSTTFYVALFPSLAGTGLVVFIMLYPDVISNLRGYYTYWRVPQHSNHWRQYDDYFKQRVGKVLREGAGGIQWRLRFYWRMTLFHLIFYAAAVVFLLSITIVEGFNTRGTTSLAVVILSLLPLIWSEISKGPKAALPLFPTFAGMLLAIGHGAFEGRSPSG